MHTTSPVPTRSSRWFALSSRLLCSGMAVCAAGSLLLSGRSQTKEAARQGAGEAAKQAAGGMGEAAKQAASGAAQQALGLPVTPVLDLLKKGEADLKAGNRAAAITAMGGFEALWQKAGPVIQPLVGDKWPAVEAAAKTVSSTFASGAKPEAGAASAAISGLMGPLNALIGQ